MTAKPVGRFEVISHPEIFDGVRVKKGQTLAVIRHNAAAILSCERVILNLMQRMSGIATIDQPVCEGAGRNEDEGAGHAQDDPRTACAGQICCLLRRRCESPAGSAGRHPDQEEPYLARRRSCLVRSRRALKGRKPGRWCRWRSERQTELEQAIAGGAESILLDNMTPAAVKRAVKQIREASPKMSDRGSGNMNLKTVRNYALAGVDYISVGALTHSRCAVDLSMRITADVY